MSLVELMIAVSIISILGVFAALQYRSYLPSAQEERVEHDLKILADAVATHDRDNPSSQYRAFDLEPLVGRYLDHTMVDPWGNPYVVDPFFGRVISLGPDDLRQQPIPGYTLDTMDAKPDSDDFSRDYRSPGMISFIAGGALYAMYPDGLPYWQVDVGYGANDSADLAPTRDRWVATKNGALKIIRSHPEGVDEFALMAGTQPVKAQHPCFSPAGNKVVLIDPDTKSIGVVGIDATTTGTVQAPGIATSSAIDPTVTEPRFPALSPDNRTIYFQNGSEIYRVSSAEASPIATMTVKPDGTAEGDGGPLDLSADGKLIAYVTASGNAIRLRSAVSGQMHTVVAGAGFKEVAFSPDSNRIAVTDGTSIFVLPAEPDLETRYPGVYPFLVLSMGGISSLSWR